MVWIHTVTNMSIARLQQCPTKQRVVGTRAQSYGFTFGAHLCPSPQPSSLKQKGGRAIHFPVWDFVWHSTSTRSNFMRR